VKRDRGLEEIRKALTGICFDEAKERMCRY
jgi:hypothetical protein